MVKIEKLPGTEEIEAAIIANDRYCICAIVKDSTTKCMCKEFRELEETGICHCGLYKKTITKD